MRPSTSGRNPAKGADHILARERPRKRARDRLEQEGDVLRRRLRHVGERPGHGLVGQAHEGEAVALPDREHPAPALAGTGTLSMPASPPRLSRRTTRWVPRLGRSSMPPVSSPAQTPVGVDHRRARARRTRRRSARRARGRHSRRPPPRHSGSRPWRRGAPPSAPARPPAGHRPRAVRPTPQTPAQSLPIHAGREPGQPRECRCAGPAGDRGGACPSRA